MTEKIGNKEEFKFGDAFQPPRIKDSDITPPLVIYICEERMQFTPYPSIKEEDLPKVFVRVWKKNTVAQESEQIAKEFFRKNYKRV